MRQEFVTRFGAEPLLAFAPGRVNLLGAHVDYNGGAVLPVVTRTGTFVAIAPRKDDQVTIASLDEPAAYRLRRFEKRTATELGWAAYVVGVLRELDVKSTDEVRDGSACRGAAVRDTATAIESGFDLLVGGTVARAAGLSSSASLEVAVALAITEAFDFDLRESATDRGTCTSATMSTSDEHMHRRRELADVAHRAETSFVGLPCGIMDPYAVALGRSGAVLYLDCTSRRFEHVALPPEVELVVLDTCKPRRLTESVYAVRVEECRAAARILGEAIGRAPDADVLPLVTFDEGQVLANTERLGPVLSRRALHVVREVDRVARARAALARRDAATVGALMTACHASCARDYEISSPELDQLVNSALAIDGVLGARLTGAGFGGCVLVLARSGTFGETERTRVAAAFEQRFGVEPRFEVVTTTSRDSMASAGDYAAGVISRPAF